MHILGQKLIKMNRFCLHCLTCVVLLNTDKLLTLTLSADSAGEGATWTLAHSRTGDIGTGELAFFFSVPVGEGMTSTSTLQAPFAA